MRNIATTEDLEKAIGHVRRNTYEASAYTEKLAMLCIRKAQEFKDTDLEFEARLVAMGVLTNRQKPDQAIAMFPWLLKKCDEDRNRFDYDSVLWEYRSIVTYAKQYASIPKVRLLEMWDDFEKRMREAGSGDKVIHAEKIYFYSEMGEIALAEQQIKLYDAATTTGKFDECSQCERHHTACFLLEQFRFEALLEMLMPVIRGEVTCHFSEGYHLHMGMIAQMMLGRWEEAEHLSQHSLRHLDYDIALIFEFSSHLTYYGITGQFAKGRKIMEKQLPYIFQNAPDLSKYEFVIGARVFFQRMKDSGRNSIKLALPENKIFYEVSGIYPVDQCIAYVQQQIEKIAAAVDERNGNDYYTNRGKEMLRRYADMQPPPKMS